MNRWLPRVCRHPLLAAAVVAAAVLTWHLRADAPGLRPRASVPSPLASLPGEREGNHSSSGGGSTRADGDDLTAGMVRLTPGATLGSRSHPGVTLTLESMGLDRQDRLRLDFEFTNSSANAVELVLDYGWVVVRDASGGSCRMIGDSVRTPPGGEFRVVLLAGQRRMHWVECVPADREARRFVFSPGPVPAASNRVQFAEFEMILQPRKPR